MSSAPSPPKSLRADARRNHEQVLAAARQVVLSDGPGAPLERIAQVAGVGIATLYRRFGDRGGLLKAVVLDALTRSRLAAEEANAEYANGFDALAAYLRALLEIQVSALIPLVLDRIDPHDEEFAAARAGSAAAMQALIDDAHADGSLADEISFGDIGTLMVRLARTLPGSFPDEVERRLTARHLEIVLAGLRTAPANTLDGVGMSLAELNRSTDDADDPVSHG